jgi:hypothetical protein
VHIYVHPPPGYLPKGKVLKLLGPLYGLRRASACWSKTVRCFLISIKWSKVIDNDDTVWFKYVPTNDGTGTKIMLLEFHVDDFLLSAHPSCSVARDEFRKAFMERFDYQLFLESDSLCLSLRDHQATGPVVIGKLS